MNEIKRLSRTHEARLFLANALLFLILCVTATGFYSVQNFINLSTSYAFAGILAAGLVVVLVSGGIDVSFTGIASIAQYVAVWTVIRYDLGWVALFVCAASVGLLLGILNAILITWLRISSIIVTIAMLNIYYGLLMFVTNGDPIYSLPLWYSDGIYYAFGEDSYGNPFAINLQMILLVVAFVMTWLLLNRLTVGRKLRALGGNPVAAERVGFSRLRLNMTAYGYMGLMAGLASLVHAQLSQSVVPNALVGRELDVLAAVVLGGASLTGGVGTAVGALLGLMLLAFLQDGLILLGVSSFWIQSVSGFVFLIAVVVIAWEQRRLRRNASIGTGAVA